MYEATTTGPSDQIVIKRSVLDVSRGLMSFGFAIAMLIFH